MSKQDQQRDPNSHQVGGGHYGGGEFQHWDFVESIGMGYLEGCATKYIDRSHLKGGLEDQKKALHYVEKVLSLANQGRPNPVTRTNTGFGMMGQSLSKFLQGRKRTPWESQCIKRLTVWMGPDDLLFVINTLKHQIAEAEKIEAKAEQEQLDYENEKARQYIQQEAEALDSDDGGEMPGDDNWDDNWELDTDATVEALEEMDHADAGPGYVNQDSDQPGA